MAGNLHTAKLGAIAGGIITAVATFLPWVTAGISAGPVDVSTSVAGIDSTLGIVTLVVALIVIGIAIGLDWDSVGMGATVASGLVVVLIGVVKLVDFEGLAGAGIGLYLSILGGLVIMTSGIVGYRAESKDSP